MTKEEFRVWVADRARTKINVDTWGYDGRTIADIAAHDPAIGAMMKTCMDQISAICAYAKSRVEK